MTTSTDRAASDLSIVAEKQRLGAAMLCEAGLDAWLIVSPDGADPSIPLIVPGTPVMQRGFFVLTAAGRCVGAVSSVDDVEFRRIGGIETIPYFEDDRGALARLMRDVPIASGRVAFNDDAHDVAWGGLSHGRHRWTMDVLSAVDARIRVESARQHLMALRAVKSDGEMRRLRAAAALVTRVLDEARPRIRPGATEREISGWLLERMRAHGVSPAFGPPTVGYGGPGYTTHRDAGDRAGAPGDQLMIDFGVTVDGFTSDISRTFYFLRRGETEAPPPVRAIFSAHRAAMDAAQRLLRPGIRGFEVDAAARAVVRDAGYAEFEHALGHQVGRLAHDGGTSLAPRTPRYGPMAEGALRPGEIYTLEPTLITPDGVVCQIEEEFRITEAAAEVLTDRANEIFLVPPDA
jgi:Xaa-Pro aminopeptidase